MYLVIIAASIPTLKPVAMTRTKFSSSRSTDSGFSWRRLFKSKGSTNQSNTDDERKISSQLRSLQSNKRPCDIHATILRYEDSNLSESVTPRTETGLDGIKKKTEFTVGYVYKSPRVNQSQVRAQREFEMAWAVCQQFSGVTLEWNFILRNLACAGWPLLLWWDDKVAVWYYSYPLKPFSLSLRHGRVGPSLW